MVIDIGADLQRAYNEGYIQGKEDEHRWWSNLCANCKEAEQIEPNCSEKPNNCETCGTPKHLCQYCIEEDRMWTPKDEPQKLDCRNKDYYSSNKEDLIKVWNRRVNNG